MNLTQNRNDLVWSLVDCLEDARIAAHSGHPCECQFPHGSHLWRVWKTEYYREIQRIVDARAAVAEGRITAAHDAADEAEVQPVGFLSRLYRKFSRLIQGV